MIGRPAEDRAAEADAEATGEQRDHPRRAVETDNDGEAHPSRRSRRSVLQGMAGIGVGVGTATPGRVLEQVEALMGQVDEDDLPEGPVGDDHDPHTVATFDAIIDAVVPNTEDDPIEGKLGAELDEIHQLGGLDTGMTPMCIDILNDFMAPEVSLPKLANTGETVPLSQALAVVLDTAASELLARGGNEDQPQPGQFGAAGGPFASLSRTDRFRALYDVENRANQIARIDSGQYSRTGGFIVALAVVFPPIVYYSDMNAYDDFIDSAPSEREFDPAAHNSAPEGVDTLVSWAQTGYPGITDGHDALLGYELNEAYEPTAYGRNRPSEVRQPGAVPAQDDGASLTVGAGSNGGSTDADGSTAGGDTTDDGSDGSGLPIDIGGLLGGGVR